MATIQNFTIDQGSTFGGVVTIYNKNRTFFNLENYSAQSQMRKSYGSSTVAATFTCVIPNPSSGQIYLTLTDEETAAIKAGRYVYDVYIVNNYGERFRSIEGIITVNPSVTR